MSNKVSKNARAVDLVAGARRFRDMDLACQVRVQSSGQDYFSCMCGQLVTRALHGIAPIGRSATSMAARVKEMLATGSQSSIDEE